MFTGGKTQTVYAFHHEDGSVCELYVYEKINTPFGEIPMRIVIINAGTKNIYMDLFQGDAYDVIISSIEAVEKLCELNLPHFPNELRKIKSENIYTNIYALKRNWDQMTTNYGEGIFDCFLSQLPKSDVKLYKWAQERIEEIKAKESNEQQ